MREVYVPNSKSVVHFVLVHILVRVVLVLVLVLVVLVTGGKQSQLLVRLTWTRLLDLDWSLTTITTLT